MKTKLDSEKTFIQITSCSGSTLIILPLRFYFQECFQNKPLICLLDRYFVNQHPTSQQSSNITHPTFRTSHIPNMTHHKHPISQTSHISNIPHPKQPISRISHILSEKSYRLNWNMTPLFKLVFASLKFIEIKKTIVSEMYSQKHGNIL